MIESFGEGKILAERTGGGPVSVIGLHGWARSREDLAGSLAGLDALAVDLPGFGLSPEPPAAWDTDDYAAQVAELIGGLSRPQVLLGHSFGGRVAVKLAVRSPELVSGLVLTGVPLLRRQPAGPRPALPFRMARWGRRHGLISEAAMETFRQRYGSEDYRRATGSMRSVLVRVVNESYEHDLTCITCPVELVWGSNDTVVPLRRRGRWLRCVANVALAQVKQLAPIPPPGVRHSLLAREALPHVLATVHDDLLTGDEL